MLTTKRTQIRPIELKDQKAVFAYRSDAETNKYQGWIPNSLEEVKEFISNNPREFNQAETWFQLVIIEKKSDKLIGDIGVHFIGNENKQCEIGCTIDKNYHSQGYASECLSSVIDHLFHKLNKHRITSSIDPENIGSIKLVEKLGFRKEAHFKESLYLNGKWVDDLVFAILKSDWQ